MNEKIKELEKQLEEIKNQHRQWPQGSVERMRLLHKWEDVENEIKELLLEDGEELNSWDW